MPKVAVIGCGHWGKNLVRNFAELGALAAVVDPNAALAEKFAEDFSVDAASFDEAIARGDVDGVVIAAPAELHAELALKAFAAGKHVYVEKPIALTMEDAETMQKASEEAGKSLMVGHLLQYHPAFSALRGLVRSGGLGDVHYAYSNRLSLGKFRVEENAFWSFAPHDISMLLSLFEEAPETVTGGGSAHVTSGVEDEYRVDMTFSGGRRAHVFASWLHPFKEQRLVVVGSKGMAVFEDSLSAPEDKLRLYRHKIDLSGRVPAPQKAEAEAIPYDTSAEPLKAECQHFLDCIANGTTPRTDAAEALRVLDVLVKASA